jgi:hypothetical protein
LIRYWTTLLNSQIHKYNEHLIFITISNQETDKFLNQTHTIVHIVYFTDSNKQLFVLSTCFDFHFETAILTTSTQKNSVAQKHTHLVEVTQDHKEMSHFSFTQKHTLTRGRLFRHRLVTLSSYIFTFLFCIVLSLQCKRETHVNVECCREIMFERTQSLFTSNQSTVGLL